MNVVDRFLKYVTYDTQSSYDSTTVPSTEKQLEFAKALVEELKALGLSDVKLDPHGIVYATLPANELGKNAPVIGLIAHIDTSPDMSGADVKPQIVRNYDGGDIVLNQEQGIVLSPRDFPELKQYVGEDLITTDGTTLLGADDKAGIAEIITAVEYLINHPEIPHGTIRLAFTPDEEIGAGVDNFDVEAFGADFAYTVDGGVLGELEYENFNAASARVRIQGRNVHPGAAKGKMINSMILAQEYLSLFPPDETPATTEGYEGFYHLTNIQGTVEETILKFIIRDFDKENFARRKQFMVDAAETINRKYGPNTVTVEVTDQYYNMKEKIEPVFHIVELAQQAMKEVGVTPIIRPVRGGTDGARLSYMGLPTPNLFTGGMNYHGRYECIVISAMHKAVEVIVKIAELCATNYAK